MYSHNIPGSNRLILFQLIAFMSTLSILCRTQLLTQTKEISLKQGMKFTLQCHKNNGSTNPQLDLQLGFTTGVLCLSCCTYQIGMVACQELAKLTSNFYCRTGPFCYKSDQCDFEFNNATIGLDGYQLACTDNGVTVIKWQIKGITHGMKRISFSFHFKFY